MKCILLAGGFGGSLWPLSRKNYPIQFAEIREGRSIFQENIARHLPYCDEFFIFTNRNYEYIVEGQLEIFQELKYKLFLESEVINTTLPVLLGLMYAGNDNVMVIGCSSIYSGDGFRQCFMDGNELLKDKPCVLFGMPIEKLDTNIGYIKHCGNDIELFVEKPNKKLLESLISQGDWLCNTGKYIINSESFLEVIKRDFKRIYSDSLAAFKVCDNHSNIIVIPEGCKTEALSKSFEKNIVANLNNAGVIELNNVEWNIINSWDAIKNIINKRAFTDIFELDCNNTTIINNTEDKLIVANGVSNTVVVCTDDAIYVEGENATSDIKSFFVNHKYKYSDYVNFTNTRYRAWGKYTVISKGEGYVVKEVVMYPNKEMSLHKHKFRSEHWAVVEGTVEITVDDVTNSYTPNTSVFVENGAYHKIANRTNRAVTIIETEIGNYISEGDIISKNYVAENNISKEIIKMKPAFKDYIWGGTRLRDNWGKDCSFDVVAESWELSAHKAGNSVIDSGSHKGMSFGEYIDKYSDQLVGWKCKAFNSFPILIKLIDSKQALSVQVHPDDDFAMSIENEYGKNEMWYVVDCDEEAYIYCGFKKNISKKEFMERLENQTITEVLNKINVKKGEAYFIPSGTVHAIGEGLLICEIQQNSNSTYRIYDYNRKDKMGNTRELHIDKALQVVNLNKYEPFDTKAESSCDEWGNVCKRLCACKYFEVSVMEIEKTAEIYVDNSSFVAMVFVEGQGSIVDDMAENRFCKGDTFFLPAGVGNVRIEGRCKIVVSHI